MTFLKSRTVKYALWGLIGLVLVVLVASSFGKGVFVERKGDWGAKISSPDKPVIGVGEEVCPLTVTYGYTTSTGEYVPVLTETFEVAREYGQNRPDLYSWGFDGMEVANTVDPLLEIIAAELSSETYPYSNILGLTWDYLDEYELSQSVEFESEYFSDDAFLASTDTCEDGGFIVEAQIFWRAKVSGWRVYSGNLIYESEYTQVSIQVPALDMIFENLDYLRARTVSWYSPEWVVREPGYGFPTGSFSFVWGTDGAVEAYDFIRSLPADGSYKVEDGTTYGTIEQDFTFYMEP